MDRPARRLDRRMLLLWWTIGGALAAAALLGCTFWALAPGQSLIGPIIVGSVATLLCAVIPPLRYRRWRYEIRDRDVFLAHGALFLVITLIPFDRIQFVESRQGPLDRVFRLTQVVVYTAAGKAGQIPGLGPGQAESLREELSRIAGAQSV